MTEKTTPTTTQKKFFVLTEVLLICPQLTAKKKKKKGMTGPSLQSRARWKAKLSKSGNLAGFTLKHCAIFNVL